LEYSAQDIEDSKYITQEKYKNKLEKDFENKVVEILEPIVGQGRVVAKVSVLLDFTKQEISQEIYEPEGTIRSQQTTEVTSAKEEKEPNVGGAPGAQSNIQNPEEDGSSVKAKSSKEEAKNIINYEIGKKIISQKNNAYADITRIAAAVTFDSTVLEQVENKDEFIQNINAIVEDTVGYKEDRGDKVTVKPFKFVGLKAISDNNITQLEDSDSALELGIAKTILQDFGEYIQYLIASILLFIFYKKFIGNNEVVITSGDETSRSVTAETLVDEHDFETNIFNENIAKNRLKAKVKSQILNNLEGLDEEDAAKYEVLIEELDKEVQNHPEDIASMLEMLLYEGDEKFR
jgi:flagellar M-ring protein FliF